LIGRRSTSNGCGVVAGGRTTSKRTRVPAAPRMRAIAPSRPSASTGWPSTATMRSPSCRAGGLGAAAGDHAVDAQRVGVAAPA
jgi:hypothetical protein